MTDNQYGSTKRGVLHPSEGGTESQTTHHKKSALKKWTAVLQNTGKHKLTGIFRIVSFVLGVPGINAFVERIIMVSFIFCHK